MVLRTEHGGAGTSRLRELPRASGLANESRQRLSRSKRAKLIGQVEASPQYPAAWAAAAARLDESARPTEAWYLIELAKGRRADHCGAPFFKFA
jgi:hypothetical protein